MKAKQIADSTSAPNSTSHVVKTEKNENQVFTGITKEILGIKQSYGYLIDGYNESLLSDGSVNIDFPVYNNRDLFASVEVLDASGNVVGTKYIEPKLLNDSVVGAYSDQFYSYFDKETGFKDTAISIKSEISVNVPIGGSVRISYGSDAAKIANLANQAASLVLDMFEIDSKNPVANRQIKEYALELAKGLFGDLYSAIEGGRVSSVNDFYEKLKSAMTEPQNVNKLSSALESLGLAGHMNIKGHVLNKVKGWVAPAEGFVSGLNVTSAFLALKTEQSQYDTTFSPSIK